MVVFALGLAVPCLSQAQVYAPEYRNTTWWKIAMEYEDQDYVECLVQVLGDTRAFGRACWLMKFTRENARDYPEYFLVEKSDLNILAHKRSLQAEWEKMNFKLFRFPFNPGRVTQCRKKPFLNYLMADALRCRVFPENNWEGSPHMPDESRPPAWVFVYMTVKDASPTRLFSAHFVEPDARQNFPGTCPLLMFHETVATYRAIRTANQSYKITMLEWNW